VQLREFRLSTARAAPGEARRFIAIVRVDALAPGARTFLEVIEPQTAIQSQAWGRLLRRTGDAAEYIFVVREPIPPLRPFRNQALRRQIERPQIDRSFDLQLALVPPADGSGDGRARR
jgi:hypothetical protein